MSTRPGTGFTKKKGGAGCLALAVGLFAIACVVAGAIALVFFLKAHRAAPVDDAPKPTANTAPAPASARRPLPPSPKRN